MTTDKATLLKRDYSRCEHLSDVVTGSGDSPDYNDRFRKFEDSRDTASVVCSTKREIYPIYAEKGYQSDRYCNRRV